MDISIFEYLQDQRRGEHARQKQIQDHSVMYKNYEHFAEAIG